LAMHDATTPRDTRPKKPDDQTKKPDESKRLGTKENPYVPTGFKAASEDLIDDVENHYFVREIVPDRTNVPALRFVCVPQKEKSNPGTFYIAQTKIPNAAFASFAEKKLKLGGQNWPDDAKPATGMTVAQAHQFAVWLRGLLPTTKQWDKAAGFWDRDGNDGPAKGPNVAIRRRGQGPLPVTEENDDVSVFGVQGMAGNGTEFTRNLLDGRTVPLAGDPGDSLVIVRGQLWEAARPLRFIDLEEQQQAEYAQTQFYRVGSRFTGFRVVVEMTP